jgi:hypothetical protein
MQKGDCLKMMYCSNCQGYIQGYNELEPAGERECVCDDRKIRGLE